MSSSDREAIIGEAESTEFPGRTDEVHSDPVPLATIFLKGFARAKQYGLESEFVQWFLDDLINNSQQTGIGESSEELVQEAVFHALWEWDL